MSEYDDFDAIQVGTIQNTLLCTHIKESRILHGYTQILIGSIHEYVPFHATVD